MIIRWAKQKAIWLSFDFLETSHYRMLYRFIYTYIYIYMCIYIYIYMVASLSLYIYIYISMYIHLYIYVFIYIYIYIFRYWLFPIPDRLYEAPTECTKLYKYYTKVQNIQQLFRLLDKYFNRLARVTTNINQHCLTYSVQYPI